MVIVYKVSPLNYLLAKRLIRIDNIGLVNVVLGERVCPELIQGNAKPKTITAEALTLLSDYDRYQETVAQFERLPGLLTGTGGADRVADMVVKTLS